MGGSSLPLPGPTAASSEMRHVDGTDALGGQKQHQQQHLQHLLHAQQLQQEQVQEMPMDHGAQPLGVAGSKRHHQASAPATGTVNRQLSHAQQQQQQVAGSGMVAAGHEDDDQPPSKRRSIEPALYASAAAADAAIAAEQSRADDAPADTHLQPGQQHAGMGSERKRSLEVKAPLYHGSSHAGGLRERREERRDKSRRWQRGSSPSRSVGSRANASAGYAGAGERSGDDADNMVNKVARCALG